jgi:hypothetical protein
LDLFSSFFFSFEWQFYLNDDIWFFFSGPPSQRKEIWTTFPNPLFLFLFLFLLEEFWRALIYPPVKKKKNLFVCLSSVCLFVCLLRLVCSCCVCEFIHFKDEPTLFCSSWCFN